MEMRIPRQISCAVKWIRSFIDSVSDQGDPVQDLMDGPIVWYDGQSESGPRALGHRSIIADPRSIRNKDLINLYKQRQWWRPVAPIILEDFLEEWLKMHIHPPIC